MTYSSSPVISSQGKSIKKFGWVLTAIIGLISLSVSSTSVVRAREALSNHTEISAQITKRDFWGQQNDNSGLSITAYDLYYSFETEDGRRFTNRLHVDKPIFDSVEENDSISVIYANHAPHINGLKSNFEMNAQLSGLLVKLALVIAFCGFVTELLAYGQRSRQREEARYTHDTDTSDITVPAVKNEVHV